MKRALLYFVLLSIAADGYGQNSSIRSGFLENEGQWDARAKYLFQYGDLNLWITDSGIVYDHYHAGTKRGHVVRMSFLHTLLPKTTAAHPLSRVTNYFIGQNTAKWESRVRTFIDVGIQNLYPGIDERFYLDRGEPRYDLILQPGADLAKLAMRFDGASRVRVDPGGNLIVETTLGNIEERGLYAYQETHGMRQRVDCAFKISECGEVSFAIGSYDTSVPLVIDPLIYSTFLGGSRDSRAMGIAVDSAGNAYLTGTTLATNFPVTTGAYQTANNGAPGYDAFVTKLNRDGTSIVYSTYVGGSGGYFGDAGLAIAIDSTGCAYITGQTQSTDFPVTDGAFQTASRVANPNYSNAFISKLNQDGTTLMYSTYVGGSDGYLSDASGEYGSGIAVDKFGDAFVTGSAASSDFPVSQGAFQTTNKGFSYGGGGTNAFVLELNARGSSLLYSTLLGGSGGPNQFGDDHGYSIAIDTFGNAYVAGITGSPDFPVSPGAFQTSNRALTSFNGVYNAFVTKLNSTGTGLVYSTYLGGSIYDRCNAIAVDPLGSVFVTGPTFSPDFPVTSGAFQLANRATKGVFNSFVAKLNSTGSGLLFATYLGGSREDESMSIAVDRLGDAFVAGSSTSRDFPVTPGAIQGSNHADSLNATAFVTEFNQTGSRLLYSTYLGGTVADEANGVAVDEKGEVYVAGQTASHDFPITEGAFQSLDRDTALDDATAFVTKVSPLTLFLALDSSIRDFGTGSLCRSTDTTITFTNGGADTLNLSSVVLTGNNFTLVRQPLPGLLLPGASDTIVIAFTSGAVEADSGTLSIRTDAANDSAVSIPIIARTIAPRIVKIVASLDKPSAAAFDTTTLSIFPDTTIANAGLSSIEFRLGYNSDLLTPVRIASPISGATIGPVSTSNRDMGILAITLIGSNMILDPAIPIATIAFRVTIADSATSVISVSNPILNGSDSSYAECVLTAAGASTNFSLTPRCGDPLLKAALDNKLPFVFQSISPNPTSGLLDIAISYPRAGVGYQVSGVGGIEYELDDALGRITREGSITGTAAQLDLSLLPSGGYYLRLSQNGFVETWRVVVER